MGPLRFTGKHWGGSWFASFESVMSLILPDVFPNSRIQIRIESMWKGFWMDSSSHHSVQILKILILIEGLCKRESLRKSLQGWKSQLEPSFKNRSFQRSKLCVRASRPGCTASKHSFSASRSASSVRAARTTLYPAWWEWEEAKPK